MKTYGYINNGILQEIILPALYDAEHPDRQEGDPSRIGIEIPIEERFTSEFIESLIDITAITPQPQPNWTYVDGVFTPPQAPVVDHSIAILARMSQIDASSVQLLRKVAIGTATEQELGILETLDEEYSLLKDIL